MWTGPWDSSREDLNIFNLPKKLNAFLTRDIVHRLVFARGRLRYSRFRHDFADFDKLEISAQQRFQTERVGALLAQTWATNSFYRKLHRVDKTKAKPLRNLADLALLPCLTKEHLRQGKVLSENALKTGGTTKVQTAGTTGSPVTIYKTHRTHANQIARRKLSFERIGIQYGAREARFWGSRIGSRGTNLRDIILNRRIFTFLGSDEANLIEAESLLSFEPDYFYGYSTMILAAAEVWSRNRIAPPRLQAIVCTAEGLNRSQQDRIASVFGCPVFMEYGCSEVDLIALQCERGAYHVADYHILLEIDPAGTGEGEAIVTELTNSLMPLIRYRLGDQLTLAETLCACGRTGQVIETISGRTLTRLVHLPDGRTFHAVVFAHIFEDLSDQGYPISRFKVWQETTKAMLIRVELSSQAPESELTELIIREVASALGKDVEVEVRYEPIPTTPGEKFTYFVPCTVVRSESD